MSSIAPSSEATQAARAKIKLLDEQVEARCAAAAAHGAHSKPIARLFRTLHDINAQAEVYACEKDDERCYMMLMTLARYYLHIIARHAEINGALVRRDKENALRMCDHAITALELLRASLLRKYERDWMEAEEAERQAEAQRQRLSEETPAAAATAAASSLAQSSPYPSPDSSLPPIPIQPSPAYGGIASPSGVAAGASAAAAAAAAGSSPASAASDASPFLSQYSPHTPAFPNADPATATPASAPSAPDYVGIAAGAQSAGQSSAPPPPPPASARASRPAPDLPDSLRPIHLPRNVLADFYAFAANNTLADVETCAILCGRHDPTTRHLWITHVLIPNQTATADTCATTDEEQLIELQTQFDLLTLGWIHTHPSQTCFLSSVDLHTHFSYQLMLSEAIAIVLAPKHSPNSGVFHCTPGGMKALTNCARTGFHKHEEPFPLYGEAPHVIWEDEPQHAAKFMDLRVSSRAQPPPGYVPPHARAQAHAHAHPHSHSPSQPHSHQPHQQPPPPPSSAYPQL